MSENLFPKINNLSEYNIRKPERIMPSELKVLGAYVLSSVTGLNVENVYVDQSIACITGISVPDSRGYTNITYTFENNHRVEKSESVFNVLGFRVLRCKDVNTGRRSDLEIAYFSDKIEESLDSKISWLIENSREFVLQRAI